MIRDKDPVTINVEVTSSNDYTPYMFYTPCFISEVDEQIDDVFVKTLKDVLDAGYSKDSLAYQYCLLSFSQRQRVDQVLLIGKTPNETYIDAYKRSPKGEYYYLVVQTKEIETIIELSDLIKSNKDYKLIFFSSSGDHRDALKGRGNVVWLFASEFWFWDSFHVISWDSDYDMLLEAFEHPEAAWISYCGNVFPSQMQWLAKELTDVDTEVGFEVLVPPESVKWDSVDETDFDTGVTAFWSDNTPTEVPSKSNYFTEIYEDKVMWGSGQCCDGEWIDNHIFDDWLKWATQRNIWKLFLQKNKVISPDEIMLRLKEVLDFGVEQQGILRYKIRNISHNRVNRTASLTFDFERVEAIISVKDTKGVLHN